MPKGQYPQVEQSEQARTLQKLVAVMEQGSSFSGQRRKRSVLAPAARETLINAVGIDNIWNAIETGTEIFLDVRKAWEDNKITFWEGLGIVTRNAPGAIKVFTHLKELGLEFVDLDQTEREILTERFAKKFHVSDKNAEYRIELIFDFGLWLVAGTTDFIEAWGQTPEPPLGPE